MQRLSYTKDRSVVSRDTSYDKARVKTVYKQRQFKTLYIPAFSVTDLPDLGDVSYCIKKYFYSVTTNISLPRANLRPLNDENFVPVLWIKDGTKVTRYKLWDDDRLTLYCGVYANTVLPNTFAIEIWPWDGELGAELESNLEFETSALATPACDCFDIDTTALTFAYVEGQDPTIDVAANTFNGPDTDHWLIGPYGETTFVDNPIV